MSLCKYACCFLLIFLLACASESATTEMAHPETPEAVVRTWQKLVDNNEFAKARQLSTPNAIALIDIIETFQMSEPADSSIIETRFLSLNCQTAEEAATCFALIEYEGEKIQDTIYLVKTEGKWLMDIPEEESDYESDVIEEMMQEIEED